MELKLDYVWLSDPFLKYALYLSCALCASILIFISIIVKKHKAKQHEIHCQEKLIGLLNDAVKLASEKSDNQAQINQINQAIKSKRFDFICAWSAIIESASETDKKNYLKVFLQLDYLQTLSKALNSKRTKEKCLAIQTVGICKINNFDDTLKEFTKTPALSAYACTALAKTQGLLSMNVLITSFNHHLISTSQLLSALVEIPRKQLINWQNKKLDKDINQVIAYYLESN